MPTIKLQENEEETKEREKDECVYIQKHFSTLHAVYIIVLLRTSSPFKIFCFNQER